MIDQSGHDTELARMLHAEGKIGVDMLRSCLIETRENRPHAGATLARMLIHKGVLSEPEANAFLSNLTNLRNLKKSSSGIMSSLAQSGPQVGLPQPTEAPPAASTRRRGTASSHDGMTVAGRAWADTGENPSDTVAKGARAGDGTQTWKPGLKVGDYRILDQIGQGGMGVVYRVEHVPTGQIYALKTLQDESDPELVERLRREADALRTAGDHKNVVRIHSHGTAFGRVFLAMELVKGGDLVSRIRKGPLPVEEAARVAHEIAEGLVFLHDKGVLHRDLKPGNVLFDERGTPKLVDFGLALTARADRMTRTGEIIGTPNFMAPEQALLERERIGPWTDVYGVGGVFYYMLTGSSPFEGSSLVEVMTKVARDPVVPPRTHRKEVPSELDALVVRSLAKEPADRPSARDFEAALARFLESKKPAPPAPAPAAVAGGLSTLKIVLLGLFMFVLVMFGALLGAMLALRMQPQPRGPEPDRSAVAPVPTATATPPAPPPAPSSKPVSPKPATRAPLAWKIEVGEVGTMTTVNRWSMRGMVEYRRTLDFTYRVVSADPRAELECTITRLAVSMTAATTGRGMGGTPGLDYDSTRKTDQRQPFQRAIGKKFSFVFDPATGTIGPTTGATPIYDAVLEAGRDATGAREERGFRGGERDRRTETMFGFPEFRTDQTLREFLDTLFHLLPDGGETVGWRWSITRTIVKDIRDQGAPLQAEAPVEVVEQADKKTIELRWTGEAQDGPRKRALSGSAEFGPRGLRRSRQHEKIEMPDQRGGMGSFELDYELVDASR